MLLVFYALGAGTFGASRLRSARWPHQAPRLGVLAWQALSWSVIAASVLGGLVLAIPVSLVHLDLASVVDACALFVRQQYSTAGGALACSLGAALGIAIAVRVAWCVAQGLRTMRRTQGQQHERLNLVARADEALGVLVVEHPGCGAYCVARRRGRVVVTTGTLASLDGDQLAAVLAHERAHLRGRHHLVNCLAQALHTAFPFVPVLRFAGDAIAELSEMIADDVAVSRGANRLTLATALVRLAESHAPIGALGAGGSTAVARVRRLVEDPSTMTGLLRSLIFLAAIVVATAPVIAAFAAAMAVTSGYCPVFLAR